MEKLYIGGHTVYIKKPKHSLNVKSKPAIIVNDGDLISKLEICCTKSFLVGIVPNDRLLEYTPWKEKAIRTGTPNFGGGLDEYSKILLNTIIPTLQKEYNLDSKRIAYGGFSLGGLAAVMSLWQTSYFHWIFSICGYFWYPGIVEYIQTNQVQNTNAEVFLLNGMKEGNLHTNRLKDASTYAKKVHQILEQRLDATTVMDKYAHHEQKEQRFQQAIDWLDEKILL